MKTAFFECFSGVSGDMILGALADLGIDIKDLICELKKLNLSGYTLVSEKVNRCGIVGTKVNVRTETESDENKHNRRLEDICNIIRKSSLNDDIKDASISVFQRLAIAEATVHNSEINEVHFHEVGAVDAIIDIVGSVVGFKKLGFDNILFSPIATGSGYTQCEHGTLPVPAPATANLLVGINLYSTNVKRELTTPTGAAILTTLGKQVDHLPDFRVTKIGYGAGSYDNPDLPNLLRIFVGNTKTETINNEVNGLSDEVWVVETNIDDMPGELFGYIIDKLFEAGAVDAYMTPIQMKKNRPSMLISAITYEDKLPDVEYVFFNQSTTLGIRRHKVFRKILDRKTISVETTIGNVRVKIGSFNGKIRNIAPEYDDCKQIADEKCLSLKSVYNEVMKSAINNGIEIEDGSCE